MKVINDGTKRVIKSWCMNPEEGAIEQAKNLANLPFIHKHIALMPDTHLGYGMPIGGVMATEGVVIPNAVGVDIGCGMQFVKTTLDAKDLDETTLKRIMSAIRAVIPVGKNRHKEKQNLKYMPSTLTNKFPELGIVNRQFDNARESLGTLGGGNHFIEIQKDQFGKVGIMVHSGSRNFGLQIANHYNGLAIELNEKWHTSIPKEWQLAFLPLDSEEGIEYIQEMNYALKFAKANRHLMMDRIIECFYNIIPNLRDSDFEEAIEIHHNFARLENHFGKNVMVHRKGATSAKYGELGIIPGSQGTASYIVKGKGNKESFMSCSHGAGRKMGRKQAQKNLNLKDEIKKLDEQGIIHAIRTNNDLDEASGAYKDISIVMEEQKDLVDIVLELKPLGVVKG